MLAPSPILIKQLMPQSSSSNSCLNHHHHQATRCIVHGYCCSTHPCCPIKLNEEPQHALGIHCITLMDEDRKQLHDAIEAVQQALCNGGMDSDWTSALAVALAQASTGITVRRILAEHGWTGTQFHCPPNRLVLLQHLEQEVFPSKLGGHWEGHEISDLQAGSDKREQLTTKHDVTWDPDHAFNVLTGKAALSCCACVAMASEDPNATVPHLLQMNGMRLEEPKAGDSVVESKGECIFFTTTARDFSGSCKVFVSQEAALALSGLHTMSEFQQAHEARAISFPTFSNCRVTRCVRHVAAKEGDDTPARVFVDTTVVAASPLQILHAPDTSYHVIFEILKKCRVSQDAMLAAHLSEIRACPDNGMRVEYAPDLPFGSGDASQLARNCHLAVALVRTTQKSRCVSTASGFLVSTAGVRDAFGNENAGTVTIHGYCSVDNLLSFKMDPPSTAKQRVCLLLITACSEEAITVHNVTHIHEGAVTETQYFIKKMRTLGMRAGLQQTREHKRMHELSKTPDSAKKCRILDGHPSGESLY